MNFVKLMSLSLAVLGPEDGCGVKFVQYSEVYWRKVLRQIQFEISHST
jgi:hypothetical protein